MLYTDGVTEAMDASSDLFGDERLRGDPRQAASPPAINAESGTR